MVEHPERGTASGSARAADRRKQDPADCSASSTCRSRHLLPRSSFRPSRRGSCRGFGYYLRTTLANAVHSGNGRTAAGDDNTDYYPVSLKQETLRPGTIYADPYGHVLVIVKRVPQTADAAGVFLAVDGQPDGTVARKRFWRGNFLFAQDPALGGPGFKRFRPVVATRPAACAGSATPRSRRIRSTATSRSTNRSSASRISTIAWTT